MDSKGIHVVALIDYHFMCNLSNFRLLRDGVDEMKSMRKKFFEELEKKN